MPLFLSFVTLILLLAPTNASASAADAQPVQIAAQSPCALSKLQKQKSSILVRAVKIECSGGNCLPFEKMFSVAPEFAQRGGVAAKVQINYAELQKYFGQSVGEEGSLANLLIEVSACYGGENECAKNATQLSHWKGAYLQALGQQTNFNFEVWADSRSLASSDAAQCLNQ
jgi:hypothetical protein